MVEVAKMYNRKPDQVRAMQLTEGNADDVVRWCGGALRREEKPGDPTDVRIQVLVPNIDGSKWANISDFVVHGHDGRFRVRNAEEFLAEYETPTRSVNEGGGIVMNTYAPTPPPVFKPLQHNPMEGYRRG